MQLKTDCICLRILYNAYKNFNRRKNMILLEGTDGY